MGVSSKMVMLKDLMLMALDLGLMRYPSFVYGRSLQVDELPPVLCLHTGTVDAFDTWCAYLANNGLKTLTSQQYLDRLNGTVVSDDREVYLTFDDGHLSIWTVVEPLLYKYGLSATCFLIPGRLAAPVSPEALIVRPRLDDVWNGNHSMDDILALDSSGYALTSWAENRIMNTRGCMDFQAHTSRHELIVVADQVVGFVTPDIIRSAHPFELAMLSTATPDDSTTSSTLPALGTPIYASASRMSAQRACFPAPDAAHACVQHVIEEDGEHFFTQPGWKRKLKNMMDRYNTPSRVETPAEQHQAILNDLVQCRQRIEQALPGHRCTHLAYPWGVGSDVSTKAAAEAGYECVYWGRVQNRLTNKQTTDPMKLARIGEDFFHLLPGQQRRTLCGTLLGKLTRRLRIGSPYLSH